MHSYADKNTILLTERMVFFDSIERKYHFCSSKLSFGITNIMTM